MGLGQGALENMAVTVAPQADFWRGKVSSSRGTAVSKAHGLRLHCTGPAQK